MIGKEERPVLLFTSREICYYSADFFISQMAEEFEKAGYPVWVCIVDPAKDLDAQLNPYLGKSYRAIIDINSLLPRMVTDNGERYVDQLDGPFYNYLVDHPFYHHPGLDIPLKNYHVLCIDEYHAAYAKKYYPHLKSVSFLPLGGTKAFVPVAEEKKKETVLFLGTYNCSRDVYEEMKELPQNLYQDDKQVLEMMLEDTELPQETAFRRLLEARGEEISDAEFMIRMNRMYHVDRYLRNYYREEAIRTLVKHKIPVTVMGNNWEQLKTSESVYFAIKPPVDFSITFQMMAEYAVMLNVSPLFKAGAHDRVFGAMANETACLTDRNIYMDKTFEDGKNIMLFSFKEIEALPDIAEELLTNREKRRNIADNAKTEFEQKHSWERRTHQLINIMEKE